MAEARSAVSGLRVPPNLEEGRNTWRDFFEAASKSAVRRYYRTRNSIRNGTWPTSTNNLAAAFLLILLWLLADPPPPRLLVFLLPLPSATPPLIQAVCLASVLSVTFFLVVMTLRQLLLRLLLSYHGWMYAPLRKVPAHIKVWGLLVRLISGYQPSLFSFQRSLPRMSVPPLRQTLKKLLVSLGPICTPDKLQELKRQAIDFEAQLGPKLQRILVLKSWWSQNYVSDWWEKYVYLMGRRPLAINSNFYALDQSDWTPTHRPAARAAMLLHQMMVFKRMMDREELAPLVLRGTIPLCMAQYEKLFSTIRRAGEEVDNLVHFDAAESRHVMVQCKGLMYSMEMFDSKNQPLGPTALEEQIEWIIKHADQHAESQSEESRRVPALTALPRTEWYNVAKKHFTSGVNAETLAAIEKAICVVVLSDAQPETLSERGRWVLHGDGKSLWFDKSFSLVVFANGRSGINVEHTMADAPVAAHCMEFFYTKEVIDRLYTDDGHCMPLPRPFRQAKVKQPTWLLWDIEADLSAVINNALTFATQNNDDLDLVVEDHCAWGKGVIKGLKVSPDAFMQLAFLLAYAKDTNGRLPLTYEASMTRLFHCGRTETVRSCTPEAALFVQAMMQGSAVTDEEKVKKLRKAADKHQDLYREAMTGDGFDRHLFALYVVCRGLGHKSAFLEEVLSFPWTLSTSQQPQQQLMQVPDVNLEPFKDKVSPGGGFGPVSDEGYGVSYMLPSDLRLFFHVSSKKSCASTDSARFVAHINASMEEMRALLT